MRFFVRILLVFIIFVLTACVPQAKIGKSGENVEVKSADISYAFDDLRNLRPEDFVEKAGDKWSGLAGSFFNEKYLFSIDVPNGWNIDELLGAEGYSLKRDNVEMAVFGILIDGYNLKTYPSFYFDNLGEVNVKAESKFPFGQLKGSAYWITYGDDEKKAGLHMFAEPEKGKFYQAFVEGSPGEIALYKYIFAYMMQTFLEKPQEDPSADRV